MSQQHERYATFLRQRIDNNREISYRCLCCRDTGLICLDVLDRYDARPGGDPASEFFSDRTFLGEKGYACSRKLCKGNHTKAVVPNPDGSSKTIDTVKFSEDEGVLDTTISADMCDWMHEQEVSRLQEMSSPKPGFNLSEAMAKIVKSMPKVEEQDEDFSNF